MGWQKGPLPPNTYQWGGVVPTDHEGSGFYFADFQGDCVKIFPGDRVLRPHEVAWYDNSITLPPCDGHRGEETGEPSRKDS